jgi:hypothetical protein
MGGKCLKKKLRKRHESNQLLLQSNLLESINSSFKTNSKIYFNIINKKIENFYYNNRQENPIKSLCLDIKDFESNPSERKSSLSNEENLCDWKNFLLKYLEGLQQEKGLKWALELIKYNYLIIIGLSKKNHSHLKINI